MIKNYTVFIVLLLLCADIFCLPNIDDISTSISNAWQQLITAIKKPARLKRYGRSGRRRLNKLKLKNTTTTTTTETPTTSVSVLLKKLSLPVLPHPQWVSLKNWKIPQQPGIGIIINVPHNLGNYL